jgi:hypothetical protein
LPVIVLLALSTAGFSANSRYRFAPCAHRVPVIANLEPAARVGWLTPILRLDQVGQSGPPCSLGHQLASRVHRNLPGPLRGRKDEVQRADHRSAGRMVPPVADARSFRSITADSNCVSSNQSLRCRETEFRGQRQRPQDGREGSRTPLQRPSPREQSRQFGAICREPGNLR